MGYDAPMQGRLIAAARVLLGWSQDELARRAGVARRTIVSLEGGKGDPKRSTETKILALLEAEGLEFTETPDRLGVAMRRRRRDEASAEPG